MKFAAWCMCWPLLGVMYVFATIGDAMGDVVDVIDHALLRLEEFSESE